MLKGRLLAGAAGCALSASTVVAGLFTATAAFGQADEIVVQARKRAESLSNIPVSGSVVGQEQIQDFGGFVTAEQLGEYITGITTEADGNPEYFIRGAGTGRNPLSDSATAQQRNGADIAGGFGGRAYQRIDNFDVQQIEVYRGPQGALYGRNAVGGVINVVDTEPKPEFGYSLLASYEFEAKEKRIEGIVNMPIVENRLFARVGVMFEDEDGLYYNHFFDDDAAPQTLAGGRIGLKWLVNESVDALFFFDYMDQNSPTFQSTSIFQEGRGQVNAGTGVDLDGNPFPTPFIDLPHNTGNQYETVHDTRGYLDINVRSAYARVNADLGFGVLSSITNARWRNFDVEFDTDGTYVGGPPASAPTCRMAGAIATSVTTQMCEREFLTESTLITQEFRITSAAKEGLTWLAGVDYRYFVNPVWDDIRGLLVSPIAVTNQLTISGGDQHFFGAFATLGYDITDQLNVTGSARLSYERKAFELDLFDTSPGMASLANSFRDVNIHQDVDPAISLSYTLNNGWLAYASWAQAHRAGGFNRASGPSNTAPVVFVPFEFGEEKANSYEFGLKGDVPFTDRQVNFALSVYQAEYAGILQNRTVLDFDDADGQSLTSANNLVNLGDAFIRGVELEFNGRFRDLPVIDGVFSFTQGITWAESEVTTGVSEGIQLANVPHWSTNTNLTYRRPLPFFENTGLGLFLNSNFEFEIGAVGQGQNDFDTLRRGNFRGGIEGDNYGQRWQLVGFWDNFIDASYDVSRKTYNTSFGTIAAPFVNQVPTYGIRLTLRGGGE
ncbi:MAG: TonB-dependent receptor [Alphaproteobacteria bacterium]|nr:TonB-dependent receptor [Alphaproteobacteria bacterium]